MPDFSDAAGITPICSILSLPLFTHHHGQAVLNLYAEQPHSFGAEGELIGLAFAGGAQAVLETGRRRKRFRIAHASSPFFMVTRTSKPGTASRSARSEIRVVIRSQTKESGLRFRPGSTTGIGCRYQARADTSGPGTRFGSPAVGSHR